MSLTRSWLLARARRWPTSANPHLLVSQQTALDHRSPPMSRYGLDRIFQPLSITPSQLRIDRILDEAHHTADPVHLMRQFGLAANTAIKYLHAAHPDRCIIDPTRP